MIDFLMLCAIVIFVLGLILATGVMLQRLFQKMVDWALESSRPYDYEEKP